MVYRKLAGLEPEQVFDDDTSTDSSDSSVASTERELELLLGAGHDLAIGGSLSAGSPDQRLQ